MKKALPMRKCFVYQRVSVFCLLSRWLKSAAPKCSRSRGPSQCQWDGSDGARDVITIIGDDALAQRLKKNAQLMETLVAVDRVNSLERSLVAVRELLPSHPAADPTITMDIHQRRLEEARRRRNETPAWVAVAAKRRREEILTGNYHHHQHTAANKPPPPPTAPPRGGLRG